MRDPGNGWKDHDDLSLVTVFMLVITVIVVAVVVILATYGLNAFFPDCDQTTDTDTVCIMGGSHG